MRFPRRAAGFTLLAFAPLMAVVYVVGLLDPVGSKLSDDGDPFGTPPPASEALIGLLVSLVLVALGVWLLRGKRAPTRVG